MTALEGKPGIAIPGFKLNKTGKLVCSQKGLAVSRKIAQRKSPEAEGGGAAPIWGLINPPHP